MPKLPLDAAPMSPLDSLFLDSLPLRAPFPSSVFPNSEARGLFCGLSLSEAGDERVARLLAGAPPEALAFLETPAAARALIQAKRSETLFRHLAGKLGANGALRGFPLLSLAADADNSVALRVFLGLGADPRQLDRQGFTALMRAVPGIECVGALLPLSDLFAQTPPPSASPGALGRDALSLAVADGSYASLSALAKACLSATGSADAARATEARESCRRAYLHARAHERVEGIDLLCEFAPPDLLAEDLEIYEDEAAEMPHAFVAHERAQLSREADAAADASDASRVGDPDSQSLPLPFSRAKRV
jgi:hypothetical protein